MKSSKRILACLMVCLLTMSLFAACGSKNSDSESTGASTDASADKSDYNITFIVKNLVNPFWVSAKEGALAAAKDYGVNVEVLAPLKSDNNEEQIQEVEQAIAKQVDAICIAPADSSGIVPAIKEVNNANIPVINFNTKIKGDEAKYESFIVAENYTVAKNVCTKLAEMMNQEGELILLTGVTASQSTIDLTKGAKDALTEFPNIELVAEQSANFARADAMTVTQNLLEAHPNVKAIYAENDEMALGAYEAVAQAGKTEQIIIAGTDGNADAIAAIKDGKLALTCDKDPYTQGYKAVEAAVKFLKGETLDPQILVEAKLVTIENVDEFIKK